VTAAFVVSLFYACAKAPTTVAKAIEPIAAHSISLFIYAPFLFAMRRENATGSVIAIFMAVTFDKKEFARENHDDNPSARLSRIRSAGHPHRVRPIGVRLCSFSHRSE